MRTLRDAAALLTAASSLDSLAPLAAAIGFAEPALPLDGDTRRGLGFEARVLGARVSNGPGALRLLAVDAHPDLPLAETLQHVAARLARNAPHALWLVVATQSAANGIAIAAWNGDRVPPRLAALVADRRRILESDAEALRALASACGERHDVLVHARWVEILGRDALSRRFYRHLQGAVTELASSSRAGTPEQRNEIALLLTSRLLFLAFVQAMGWLDGDHDYLARRFEHCIETGGGFHRRVLLPLFFGTLNTPVRRRAAAARALGRIPFLNGGLFSRTPPERALRHLLFGDDALGAITNDLFARYRFTAREETSEWAEAAIDPEMLGHTFETLMAADRRRDAGAFFTPQALVARITEGALERVLGKSIGAGAARRLLDADAPLTIAEREPALRALATLTVLDPSCGSGAFLVHAMERLAALRVRAGDPRPLATVRRDVLAQSIFGVDRDPTAVWLCELRLWLSVVIESGTDDPLRVPPLPNLDRNIRVGDTLAGPAFDDELAPSITPAASGPSDSSALGVLRARYTRASGVRKRTLARALDAAERRQALVVIERRLARLDADRRHAMADARARDLFGDRRGLSAELRQRIDELRRGARAARRERTAIARGAALPLSFPVHFADVAERAGFDLLIGNPPWVRLHRIPPDERQRLRERFEVMRAPAWRDGAANARAGAGFGGQTDLAALFIERSLRLVRPGGAVALLVPVKLWQSLAGGGVRRLLDARANLVALEDRRDAGAAFDAVVYPSVIIAERKSAGVSTGMRPVVSLARVSAQGTVRWRSAPGRIPLDASADSPWLIVPRVVRDAFDVVRAAGVALHASTLGAPTLGVKCGCNDAFIVNAAACDRLPAELLRPVLRGSGVRAWRVLPDDRRLLWTHGDSGALRELPPSALRHLTQWRAALQRRSDFQASRRRSESRSAPWWTLFRTEGADSSTPRVVWADLGREPRAVVLPAGDVTVPINTCYVARTPDESGAFTLATLLNSALASAWLSLIAESARGGHFRFLAWTMALLPIPADWDRAVAILAPMGERAHAGARPARDDVLSAVLEAYRLRRRDVAPLLAWSWDGD